MTAKEMFENLDYEWTETSNYIQYTKYKWKHWIFKSKITICFWKYFNNISINDEIVIDINQELLRAINKQVKELGWE